MIAGGVASIIGKLEPYRERGEAVAKCIDYFKGNRERLRCDSYRKRGMQIGYGVVESSCRNIVGMRLKRPRKPLDAQGGERHAGNQMCACEHAPGGFYGLESRIVASGLFKNFDLRPKEALPTTKPEYISAMEIMAAADMILKEFGHVETDELVREISRLLGYKRAGREFQARVKDALKN